MCPLATAPMDENRTKNKKVDSGRDCEDGTTTSQMDVLAGTASDLAAYLLQHRFQGDALATATFLLECTSTLPNAEELSAQLLGRGDDDDKDEQDNNEVAVEAPVQEETFGSSLGKAVTTAPIEISSTTPRGRLHWTLHTNGMHFRTKGDDQLVVHASSIEHIVVFPKPEDCRKPKPSGGDMMLLCFKHWEKDHGPSSPPMVRFKDKTLSQLCFQLPVDVPRKVASLGTDEPPAAALLSLICESLSFPCTNVVRAQNPRALVLHKNVYTFRSHSEHGTSTTTGGMPFVQCYHGVQDGVVFPLQEGLLFFKPPLFVHRSRLHSIACGRGSGGSRYVDMQLTYATTEEDQESRELEFSNIHRDELQPLNDYIHNSLIPAMKRDVDETKNDMEDDAVMVHGTTPEEDNEAHGSTHESSQRRTSNGKRRQNKRKAAQEAQDMNRSQVNHHESESEEEEEDGRWCEGEESETEDDEDESGDEQSSLEEESCGRRGCHGRLFRGRAERR